MSIGRNKTLKKVDNLMRRWFSLILIIACIAIARHGYTNQSVVLINGRFLTLDPDNTVVSALGFQSGRIRALGEQTGVIAKMTSVNSSSPWHIRVFGIRLVDLQNQSVVPGFIDAHSHFPASGLVDNGMDLSSPPFGDINDMSMLLQAVADQAEQQTQARWVIGFNYDDAALSERRHPTRAELDEAAPDHAVYLRHRSGHMGVANSLALRQLGYDLGTGAESVDPTFSSVLGFEQQAHITGLLQETAAPSMQRLLKEIPWWRLASVLFRARDEYLQAGVTTLQNGFTDKPTLQLLRYAAKLGLIPQRIVVWPAHDKLKTAPAVLSPETAKLTSAATSGRRLNVAIDWPLDDNRQVSVGAIKLIADGSPQGRTAWMSEPYLHDELLGRGYRGIANIQERTLHGLIRRYHKAGFQLALHGNGDAAIQSIIDGLQAAYDEHPRKDARHIIVHAQTINRFQLQALVDMKVSVSFFPTHTFYWGDWYRERVLGEERAARISPLATADTVGVRYSIHSDSPVTPIDPMQMLWSATERLTMSGQLIGASERVSRLRALRAMTIDAAWQNHLDGDRGSIELGKLADFVVLSENPLTSDDVRDISVKQVWIDGKRRLHIAP